MSQVVSITSQGQITIPAKLRREIGLNKRGKALLSNEKGKILVEPVRDLLELGGSLNFLAKKKKYDPAKAREMFAEYVAEEYAKSLR